MEYRLLGHLEVAKDAGPVVIEGPRPRAVLAVLALSAGRAVSTAAIVEGLWGDGPPDTAHKMVQMHVSRLRRQLPVPVLSTRAPGYVLEARPEQVDALRAESLLREGRRARAEGADRRAAQLFTNALALWRGRALDEFDEPFAVAEGRRLEDLRLALQEELLEARLALGLGAEIVADAEALAAAAPLRERARRVQMLALYRSGRQADALAAYEATRRTLAEELGVDPSLETRELHRAILRQDAALARSAAPPAPEPAPEPALIGRDPQLHAVEEALQRAGGRATVAVVTGEPGVGKSSLCEAIASRAGARGLAVIAATASEDEAGVPYGPLRAPLAAVVSGRADILDRLPAEARRALAPLGLVSHPGEETPAAGGDGANVRVAVGLLLDEVARDGGVAVVLDDLHHADDSTSGLLRHLASTACSGRRLIAVAVRAGTPDGPGTRACAAMLGRHDALDLRLGPLARLGSDSLVRRVAPAADDAVAEMIWCMAGGNPLLTEQLAAGAARDGGVHPTPRLAEIVAARLGRLGRAGREALALAAATGGVIGVDDFRAMSGLDEEQALTALDEATVAGVVLPRGDGFGFRAPVLREVLAGSLPAHRVVAAHRRAAERLMAEGAPPARVAHHLVLGGRPRDAVPWQARAIGEAMAMRAWGDALTLADAALPHAAGPERAELLERRAELRLLTGAPGAVAAFAEAVAEAPGARTTALRIGLARAHLAEGRIDAAALCLEEVVPGDRREAARLALYRGVVAWHAGDNERARGLAAEAESALLPHGSPGEMRMVTNLRGLVAHSGGDWTGAIRLQLVGVRDAPELEAMLFDAYVCVGEFLLSDGHPHERVVAAADDLRRLADEAGARRGVVFATTLMGEADLLAGRLDDARRRLEEASRLAGELGAGSAETLARLRLGETHVAAGDRDLGRRLVAEAGEAAHWLPLARHLVPLADEAAVRTADDPMTALAAVEAAEASADPSATCMFCSVGYAAAAAAACARGGRPRAAREMLRRAEASAARWRERRWAAVIAEGRGVVAAAEGRQEEAAGQLRAAVDRFRAVGQELNAGRVHAILDDLGAAARPPEAPGRG